MPELALLAPAHEVAARARDVVRDVGEILPLRAVPAVLRWLGRTDAALADAEESRGLALAAALEGGTRGEVEEALDDWLDVLEEATARFRARVGDPAEAPIPIWCWWARYTSYGARSSTLSRALEEATGLPADHEADLGGRGVAPERPDRPTLLVLRDEVASRPLPRDLPSLLTWVRGSEPGLSEGEHRAASILSRRMVPGTSPEATGRAARAWLARVARIRSATEADGAQLDPPGGRTWLSAYSGPLRAFFLALLDAGLLEEGAAGAPPEASDEPTTTATDPLLAEVLDTFGGTVVAEGPEAAEEWDRAVPAESVFPDLRASEQAAPTVPCRACGGARWWRTPTASHWTCGRCVEPAEHLRDLVWWPADPSVEAGQ